MVSEEAAVVGRCSVTVSSCKRVDALLWAERGVVEVVSRLVDGVLAVSWSCA